MLLAKQIKISLDGKGRALDNVFVERLWRSVKYECLYLREWVRVADLDIALQEYFDYDNNRRYHQGLGYRIPAAVHYG